MEMSHGQVSRYFCPYSVASNEAKYIIYITQMLFVTSEFLDPLVPIKETLKVRQFYASNFVGTVWG